MRTSPVIMTSCIIAATRVHEVYKTTLEMRTPFNHKTLSYPEYRGSTVAVHTVPDELGISFEISCVQ